MTDFTELFGRDPEFEASAPGRVNLLGEHTDYNDGFVLPAAIPQRTHVELARSPDGWCRFHSDNLNHLILHLPGDAVPGNFGRYAAGCIEVLRQAGFATEPVLLRIRSDVPIGSGLSSSAALEVALLRGLRELFRLELDDVEIARLAQTAEIHYAGVRCGIMDQMAASLCTDTSHMLFIDTRTLENRLLPLPEGTEPIVLDSGVPRSLSGSAYNRRRRECEEAARRLGVAALRDVDDPAAAATLPPPLDRRARHVITENGRVLRAAAGVSAGEFGVLMNSSHASLRDEFEVSVPALDLLAALLQRHPAVHGARLTGAGFGGACVALAGSGQGKQAGREVLAAYTARGHHGRQLV